jgi:hypothetical protein
VKRWYAAVTLLVVAAVAAVAWWATSSSSGPDAIARARRAFGSGRVVHVIATLDIQPGAPAMQPIGSSEGIEVWYDTVQRRTHAVLRAGKRLVSDSVEHARPPVAAAAPLYAFLSGYRPALDRGEYRVEGSAQVEGRHVIWLTAPRSDSVADVAVDPDTYQPVWVRTGKPLTWLSLVETKPYDPADFVPQSQRKARHL